ncbi:ABC transporter ATP-binding protein [Ancylobacter dichloromethanicus]|uniref:Iron-hydroxamate transporter ATP-binding protein n=1 Tax=Ancylobacter dichloromethanicus TaxID=518825 RepID=A0A9W6J780_9HYPH|nr:ATP-binding cassette domain-containing protein [Ancylobacter dichloromethanicus]GLK72120.1 iron-hydroxamate transporter ATP-binding protein [Ancylobacter dichloromethanicus]
MNQGKAPTPSGALWSLGEAAFAVGERSILGPLTLDLPAGRVYGLIGPNGSGKSTLLKMLARQLSPSSGEVRFEGRPLGAWAGRAFAREVAYMPQFTPPSDGMSVRELVRLGRYPWHGALGRFTDEDEARVEAAIQRTGLAAFRERAVDSLSGGERQRAWLALMLAQGARCLLLDEPTSALDIAHQMEVLALLRTLGGDAGGEDRPGPEAEAAAAMTVIVILHDINLAARTCDTLLALRAGRMVAHGPSHEIMQPDRLREIYGLAMGVMDHPVSGKPMSYVL